MCEENNNVPPDQTPKETDDNIDENMVLFVYGNLKIRDLGTGEVLVNKRF